MVLTQYLHIWHVLHSTGSINPKAAIDRPPDDHTGVYGPLSSSVQRLKRLIDEGNFTVPDLYGNPIRARPGSFQYSVDYTGMCHQLQIITSLLVCAKRVVTYVRHWNNVFWGCLHGVTLCATYALLGKAAVRGLIDCIFKIGA